MSCHEAELIFEELDPLTELSSSRHIHFMSHFSGDQVSVVINGQEVLSQNLRTNYSDGSTSAYLHIRIDSIDGEDSEEELPVDNAASVIPLRTFPEFSICVNGLKYDVLWNTRHSVALIYIEESGWLGLGVRDLRVEFRSEMPSLI